MLGLVRDLARKRRLTVADHHPQVQGGDGVRRRGHGAAPRQLAGERQGRGPDRDDMTRDDDRRAAAPRRARTRAPTPRAGAVRLAVEDLERRRRRRRRPAVRGVTLAVRAGEIVGIAGVSGNGQKELVEVLGGQREADERPNASSTASPITPRRDETQRHDCRVLPEEPLRNGCVPRMTVADNLHSAASTAPPWRPAAGWLDRARCRDDARAHDRALRLKTPLAATRRSACCPAATCSAACWRANSTAKSIS